MEGVADEVPLESSFECELFRTSQNNQRIMTKNGQRKVRPDEPKPVRTPKREIRRLFARQIGSHVADCIDWLPGPGWNPNLPADRTARG